MRCTIPGHGVKLFGRSVLCLSKIGDELHLDALDNEIALRTVNASRSAYACFTFSKSFFITYESGSELSDSPGQSFRCKLGMKACLGVFKSLNSIDKIVDHCTIVFDVDDVKVVFTLACRHGIIKTYNLAFQECDSLQAVFAKDLCPNLIVAPSKTLLDSVGNFPNSCDEISLVVTPRNVVFKNYVEDEKDPSKIVHTEMTLVPEEFDDFQIGIDGEITFCLKELRAILAFSEFSNQPLNIQFEAAGKPVVFTLDGDTLYSADFVLATLMDENRTASQMSSQPTQTSSLRQQDRTADLLKESNGAAAKRSRQQGPDQCVGINDRPSMAQVPKSSCSADRNADQTDYGNDADDDDFFGDSFPYKDLLLGNTGLSNESGHAGTVSATVAMTLSTPIAAKPTAASLPVLGDSFAASSGDVVVGTPPQKKFKSLFFEAGKLPAQTDHEVLAADTDEEDC